MERRSGSSRRRTRSVRLKTSTSIWWRWRRRRILRAGAKVKVPIMFRGREMARTELGRKILDRLVADLGDTIVVEATPKQDGRNMVMVIAPTKKAMEKPEAKEQR